MSTYTSVNGTFTYTITNTSSYVFDSTDYAIIQSAFDRWDNIMTLDSRVGAGYTITINYSVEVLEAGILGGASIQTVGYIGSQTFGNTFPYEADITLNATYLSGMKNAVRSDGKTSYYYVLLHEIGHILGIGSFWNLPGTPKVSYLDNGVTKYYYTGANALREYKSYFTAMGSSSFVGVPIEDNGGAGTVNVHPEEGLEGGVSADNRYINGILHPGLDTELMTGWLDSAPVSTPLSRITLGFLADMGYTVNYNLADLYTMAAGSGTSSISWASPTETILRASNLGASDSFGVSVAISGDYAIVGANNEDGTSTSATTNDCGAAYIFERDGSGNWTEKQILRASNFGINDQFGWSVAISGNYAIVGAYLEDGTSGGLNFNSGAAYIFERDGSGVWNEKQILRASNLESEDRFGISVAISGNYAIVGAYYEDGSSTSTTFNSGAAYIFERDGSGNWNEKQILRASNLGEIDYFGRSVAIDGNYAIVGAPSEDGSSTSTTFNSGAAYIFERNGSGDWTEKTILRASNLGNSDNFGFRVAISGNYAIVGAYLEDDTSTSALFNCGAAYIFERDGSGNWNEKQILRASNLGEIDNFGISVAISGNYAIVGANQEDGNNTSTTFNSGAAYIFERNASTGVWTEIKILRASNLDANDLFGISVAISGNYVIVGANNEDSSNTSTTFNSGAAYIYTASLVQSPTMTITSTTAGVTNGSTTNNASIELTFTSSEATTNFAVEDISVTNGTLSTFASSSPTVYTATFAPTRQGTCTINVAAGAYTDAVGNNNAAATTFSVNYIPNFAAFNNANNLEQTYIAGFLDVSGSINQRNGDLNVMDGNLLVSSGDVSLNNGNLYVGGNMALNSGLAVNGSTTLMRASVSNNMDVSGATNLVGALAISGLTSFNNNVSVSSNKTFTVGTGATAMGGSATMNSTLAVAGGVSMKSGLRVAGATTLTNAIMDGPVSVSGRVVFLNDISFTGPNVDICGNLRAQYPANSIPAAAIIGGINVVSLFNNDVSLSQTLSVGGATSLSTLTATGNATLRSTVGIAGATTMSALTTSGATTVGGALSVVGKAALTNDVSFNGSRIDICGNLYANYPANSIPLSAVVGGGEIPVFMTDVSVNAAISAAGATTLQSTLVVSGQTTLANDVSFNAASRIDICGNLYANYPANSIPSAAIIGGTAVASTFNTDVSMNSRLYVKNSIKIGNLATLQPSIQFWNQDGATLLSQGTAHTDSVSLSADGSIVAFGVTSGNFVRVYQRNIANNTIAPIGWTQLGGDIVGENSGDNSGSSVSLSADGFTVAIGAYTNDGTSNDGFSCGHVRVYKYNANKTVAVTDQSLDTFGPVGWDRLGADIDGEASGDYSGYSYSGNAVSLSSNGLTVAIGAFYNDGTSANSDRGHVRVYKYNADKNAAVTDQSLDTFGPKGWDRLGGDIDGEAKDDKSGDSISLSADGSIVAIGAKNNDGTTTSTGDRGHVRVYKYRADKTVAITDQNSSTFGPVGWDRLGADIDGEAPGDESGYSVSLSADGSIVAIGAHWNNGTNASDTNHGHVRIYKYNADKAAAVTDQSLPTFGPKGWDRLGGDIDGEANGDESGNSVSLSADGSIVAIGAPYNDGSTDKGHVRVYKYRATKTAAVTDQSSLTFGPVGWDRIYQDIDGIDTNVTFGRAISLSANGSTVAVTGRNTYNYTSTYAVKVYKVTDPQLSTSVLSTSGLQTAGIATISGPLAVTRATTLSTMNASGAASMTSLNITGATTLNSTMTVSGSATIGGTLLVTGTSSIGVSTMNSTLSVGAATTMSTKLVANSDVSLNNKLTVTGATTMNSTLTVAGATTLNNTAFMTSLVTAGAVTQSTLYVAKSVTMNGDLDTSGVLLMSAVTMPSTLTTGGAAVMSSQLSVAGATTMRSTLNTTGAVTIGGILSVAGVITLSGATTMNGKVSVGGDVSMNSTLIVTNNATLASTLAVVGASTLSSTLYTSGSTTINNTLNVNGKTTFLNDVSFNNNVTVSNRLNMNNNRITIGSSNIQYNAGVSIDGVVIPTAMHTTNNATVGGVLTIAGSATLSSTLTVGGAVTSANVYASSNATLGSTLSVAGAATVGPLTVSGATTVSTLTTTGATTVGGTLGITGASTMATLNVYGPMRQW